MRLSAPTTNYGTDPSLYVGVTNGVDKVYRTFIAFNLSDIPAGATVTGCTLRMNVTQRTNPTAGHVRRLCGEHWLDGDGQGEAQATWNVWKSGLGWGITGAGSTADCATGGDYAGAGEIPYTPPAGTGFFTFPDLSALCQDALGNRGGWLRLRISQDSEATQSNLLKFDSSDASTAGNRPRLTVAWTLGGSPTTTTTSSTVPTTSRTSTTSTSVTTSTSTSRTTTSSRRTTTVATTSSSTSTSPSSTISVTTTSVTSTTLAPGGTNVYQAGVSGPAGSANVDTNVRLSTPTTTYGSDPSLIVGMTNGVDKVYRTFIAFDLGDIPAGAIVTGCTLRVNVTQRTNPTPGHVRRLCGEHWRDGDGQGEAQATWNVWTTGSTWGLGGAGSTAACASGGDYTTSGEIPYTPPAGTGAFTFPDLAALCQDALDNRGGWLRLRFSQDSEATQSNLIKFDSSDASTAANRPRLTVTWSSSALP